MIYQHYYANGYKGLYNHKQGPDTVAKSKNLDDGFVTSVLHDHCLIETSNIPDKSAKETRDSLPINYFCYWAPTGELVVGRTVYKRPNAGGDLFSPSQTFFTHSFVVPARLADDLLPDYMNLPYIADYHESYDIDSFTPLPVLAAFRYSLKHCRMDGDDAALLQMGVGEDVYKTMLGALIEALEHDRKVYIVLNVDTGSLHDAARKLTKNLIAGLPYSFRKKLGYATYVKSETEQKGINLCFLTRDFGGNISESALGEYVFDFNGYSLWWRGRFAEASETASPGLYAGYIWNGKSRDQKRFFEFIDKAYASDHSGEEALDSLTAVWNMAKLHNHEAASFYRERRMYIASSLLRYVRNFNASVAPVVNEAFTRAVSVEEHDMRESGRGSGVDAETDYFSSIGLLSKYIQYAEAINTNSIDRKVVGLCVKCVAAYRNADRVGQITGFFGLAAQSHRIFMLIQKHLTESFGGVFEGALFDYAQSRLSKCNTMYKLSNEIEFWLCNNPHVFADSDVIDAFSKKAHIIVKSSPDPVREGADFHSGMEFTLKSTAGREESRAIANFVKKLLNVVDRNILDSIKSESITYETLVALKIDSDSVRYDEKFKTIESIKKFMLTDSGHDLEKSLGELRAQGAYSYSRSVDIILRILKDRIHVSNYGKIIAVFTEPPRGEEGERIDFDGIFEYLNKSRNKAESCKFIKWAFGNNIFPGGAHTGFSNSVIRFFAGFTPGEFKIVSQNYAYLYVNPDKLSDSDKNLKHIIDGIRQKNAAGDKTRESFDVRAIGGVALVSMTIVFGIILIFMLLPFIINR